MPERFLDARLLAQMDPVLDLAVLSVDDPGPGFDFCALPLGRMQPGDSLQRGDPVYPAGYPNGVPWAMSVDPNRIAQIVGNRIVFESAFISPGHSGGALVTPSGKLIGMIRADTPPYGVAIRLDQILDRIVQWGLPEQLHAYQPYVRTPLHEAAAKGDIDSARRLLADCHPVNARDERGMPPLHEAAAMGHAGLVRLLLDAGTAIDAKALVPWKEEEVRSYADGFLWNRGIRMVREWKTPLHLAAEHDAVDAVRILLDRGARVDTLSLLRFGDDQMLEWKTPLQLTASHDAARVAELLLERGAQIAPTRGYSWTPLHLAAEQDAVATAKVLLAHGADVHAEAGGLRRETPLHTAAMNDSAAVAGFLIQSGAEVNRKGDGEKTPLHFAAEHGADRVASLLLDAGADPDAGDRRQATPLLLAAAGGNTPVVDLLIARGADLNLKTSSGSTALERAVSNGHVQVVKHLLDVGASFEARPSGTLLHEAADRGHAEIVTLLAAMGFDVNAETSNDPGDTPLHKAVGDRHAEVVLALLKAGADVNRPNRGQGRTPLHMAAQRNWVEGIGILLEASADVHAKDRNGHTPLYPASGEATQLLREHSAVEAEPDR
jgi:ankyrin repeat protein